MPQPSPTHGPNRLRLAGRTDPPRPRSTLAVAACVLGCIAVVGAAGITFDPITSYVAIPCAILALVIGGFEQRALRAPGNFYRGRELALLGMILGGLVLLAVLTVLAVSIAHAMARSPGLPPPHHPAKPRRFMTTPEIIPYQTPQARTSALAVASMILGIVALLGTFANICCLIFLLPVAAICAIISLVLGCSALAQIRRSAGALIGRGFALTGITCSIIFLVLELALVITAVAFIYFGSSAPVAMPMPAPPPATVPATTTPAPASASAPGI